VQESGVYGWAMGLLSFLLSAANTFGKLLGWLRNQDTQERERIATYFDQIAECIQEVAERIEADDPPRDTCRRLAVYADQLQQILTVPHSLTVSGDESIEETRRRLVEEIKETQRAWLQAGQATMRRQEIAANMRAAAKKGFRSKPQGDVNKISDELELEISGEADRRIDVQRVWDAAGEFKALADSIRAR